MNEPKPEVISLEEAEAMIRYSDQEGLRQQVRDIICQELEAAKAFDVPLFQLHLHLSDITQLKSWQFERLTESLQRGLWIDRIAEKLVHSLEER